MEVKTYRLKEVCDIRLGKRAVADEKGQYEVYGAGANPTKRSASANAESPCIRLTRKATLGEVYLHREPFWAEDACCVLTPKPGLRLPYLLVWLEKNKELIASLKKGEVIPNLDMERFENLSFELPPLDYQDEVCRFLGGLAREIDGLLLCSRLVENRAGAIREKLVGFEEENNGI